MGGSNGSKSLSIEKVQYIAGLFKFEEEQGSNSGDDNGTAPKGAGADADGTATELDEERKRRGREDRFRCLIGIVKLDGDGEVSKAEFKLLLTRLAKVVATLVELVIELATTAFLDTIVEPILQLILGVALPDGLTQPHAMSAAMMLFRKFSGHEYSFSDI